MPMVQNTNIKRKDSIIGKILKILQFFLQLIQKNIIYCGMNQIIFIKILILKKR